MNAGQNAVPAADSDAGVWSPALAAPPTGARVASLHAVSVRSGVRVEPATKGDGMQDAIGSLEEALVDEAETDCLTADYIARRSAETDAEYGWPAGTTAALWNVQAERWKAHDGTHYLSGGTA